MFGFKKMNKMFKVTTKTITVYNKILIFIHCCCVLTVTLNILFHFQIQLIQQTVTQEC